VSLIRILTLDILKMRVTVRKAIKALMNSDCEQSNMKGRVVEKFPS